MIGGMLAGLGGRILAFFLRPLVRIPLLILSVILYGVTVLSAYGGRFNPDFFTLPATLTLLMPGLAIATVLVAAGWFLIRGYIGGTLGVLAVIASWGPVSTAIPFGSEKKATPGAETFTLLTWNMIHGWDQQGKSVPQGNRAIQYILDTDADIVAVEELEKMLDPAEIHGMTDAQKRAMEEKYPYRAGLHDMKVFSKFPMRMEQGYNYIDGPYDRRRYSFYKIGIHGRTLTLVAMHLQSFMLSDNERDVVKDMGSVEGMKKSFGMLRTDIKEKLHRGFKKRKQDVDILRRTIDRMKGPLIICGDFNDVPESYAYRLLKGTDMRDAYVETGFGPLVTYNRHAFWVHLDQVLYRGPLEALSVRKGRLRASDHYPLLCTFEFTDSSHITDNL